MADDDTIDLNAARAHRTPPTTRFWQRGNPVSFILAERSMTIMRPAEMVAANMYSQFMRPHCIHATPDKLWCVFTLNQSTLPLSMGLQFTGEYCALEVSAGQRITLPQAPVDNPWDVLTFAHETIYPQLEETLGTNAGNSFYWFLYAYRSALTELATRYDFYRILRDEAVGDVPARLPKKALLSG